jgi:hypothetical protein
MAGEDEEGTALTLGVGGQETEGRTVRTGATGLEPATPGFGEWETSA